jgi:hypothetical protein
MFAGTGVMRWMSALRRISPNFRMDNVTMLRALGSLEKRFWLLDQSSATHIVLAAEIDGHLNRKQRPIFWISRVLRSENWQHPPRYKL